MKKPCYAIIAIAMQLTYVCSYSPVITYPQPIKQTAKIKLNMFLKVTQPKHPSHVTLEIYLMMIYEFTTFNKTGY